MKFISRQTQLMIGASFLHSLWLMVLSFMLLNWHFVHWDEGELIQFGPILKKLVLEWEEKPPQEDLMFVNVSFDNQLVDFFDQEGFPMGNERITDREKLAEFVELLGTADNHKAVFIDVRFDLPSDSDEVLEEAFQKSNRVIVSNHRTNGVPDKPVIDVKSGISDYPKVGGSFFKFQYFYSDTIKTIPILLDEMIRGKNYEFGRYFFTDGSGLYFNTFLTDLLVRPHDIKVRTDNYFYVNLGDLLFVDAESFADMTRDKIIVVGDFEKYDVHETLLGDMPGPLILLNAYYTLANGTNKLSWLSMSYVFLAYFVLSLIIFIPGDPLEDWLKKISGSSQVASALAGIFSYFIILILIVLTSYIFFDLLLNVLWLTFYLYILDKVVTGLYRRFGVINKKGEADSPTSPEVK